MSVYQGLGRYRHESGREFLIVFDERSIKLDCGTLPLLGYDDPRYPCWFKPEQFTQYLGPLVPPGLSLQEKMQEIRAGGFAVGDPVRVNWVIEPKRHGKEGVVVEIQDHGNWPIIVEIEGETVGYAAECLRHARPSKKLPTPEQLKDLPACYHGLGWYYSRLGELCQVLADLIGSRTAPGRSVVSHNCCSGRLSWHTTSGYVETDGSHHHGDLVHFVGPDKPEQETYAEYYAAHKPRVPREWWINVDGCRKLDAWQTPEAAECHRPKSCKTVHVRKVL